MYLMGSERTSEEKVRILKISRTDANALDLTIDPNEYTERSFEETLDLLDRLNSATGGVKDRGTAFGMLGFVQLWQGCYYMLLITKRRKVGIIGGHKIYAIEET